MKLLKAIALAISLFLSLSIIYFSCWRIILMYPPQNITQNPTNSETETGMVIETTVAYYILKWGFFAVYSTEYGDLTHYHRDFLTFISIIAIIISWFMMRGSKDEQNKIAPF